MEAKEVCRIVDDELTELDRTYRRLAKQLNGGVWNIKNFEKHKELVYKMNEIINRQRDLHTWKRLTNEILGKKEVEG